MAVLATGCFLGITVAQFRHPMGDEAAYLDPALRWLEGKGWTSTCWGQPSHEFYAGYVPLYPLAASAWMAVFGSSLESARHFAVVCFTAAMLLLLDAGRRWGWWPSRGRGLLFVGLVAASLYGLSIAQTARPDAWCLLMLSVTIGIIKAPWPHAVRLAGVFLGGAACALSGLQTAPPLAVLALGWLAVSRGQCWPFVLACAAGGATALAAYAGLLASQGVLDPFLASTIFSRSNRWEAWHGWRDPMLWACAGALGLFTLFGPRSHRLAAVLGWGAGLGTGLALFASARFPQYYAHLAILPLAAGVAAAWPPRGHGSPWISRLAATGLAGAAVTGFPLVCVMVWNTWDFRDQQPLAEWARTHLRQEDRVYCDPGAFFAVRPVVGEVWSHHAVESQGHAFGPKLTALVLWGHPVRSIMSPESVKKVVGGSWREVAVYKNPQARRRVEALAFLERLSYSPSPRYILMRRAAAQPELPSGGESGTHFPLHERQP